MFIRGWRGLSPRGVTLSSLFKSELTRLYELCRETGFNFEAEGREGRKVGDKRERTDWQRRARGRISLDT